MVLYGTPTWYSYKLLQHTHRYSPYDTTLLLQIDCRMDDATAGPLAGGRSRWWRDNNLRRRRRRTRPWIDGYNTLQPTAESACIRWYLREISLINPVNVIVESLGEGRYWSWSCQIQSSTMVTKTMNWPSTKHPLQGERCEVLIIIPTVKQSFPADPQHLTTVISYQSALPASYLVTSIVGIISSSSSPPSWWSMTS